MSKEVPIKPETSDREDTSFTDESESSEDNPIITVAPSKLPALPKKPVPQKQEDPLKKRLLSDRIPTGNYSEPPLLDLDIETTGQPPTRPGTDPSLFFNYGFTEETWRLYAMKQIKMRRELVKLKEMYRHFVTQTRKSVPQCSILNMGRDQRRGGRGGRPRYDGRASDHGAHPYRRRDDHQHRGYRGRDDRRGQASNYGGSGRGPAPSYGGRGRVSYEDRPRDGGGYNPPPRRR
eukprot:gnl/Dysnectes_brevis/6227_a9513_428.p1 GENE.gnl/Dysnectes_brevis/6227_a9513_428~~gnl/Dysnectes_brevis/6227_a9513_428.p1  ORF type:complete len:234 (+),score=37.32 gnl/Dysnectes_brevis/6227_a9513_428:33-734(+)